jgi:hypothetical protein
MSEKVCVHPSLTPELADLLGNDVNLTVTEMQDRVINYLVEVIYRIKFLDTSTVKAQEFLADSKAVASRYSNSVAEYVLLRELHEYLKTIPKLEKYK